jgi:uncharacterized protein
MIGAVEQRVSLVTLGVADVAAAHRFYEGLGWTPGPTAADDNPFWTLEDDGSIRLGE